MKALALLLGLTAGLSVAAEGTGAAHALEESVAKQRASAASMAASIEKQRASVRKQVETLRPAAAAFYAAPWSNASAAARLEPAATIESPQPECDPMPASEIAPLIEQAARREDLRRDLLNAVIKQESAFRPCAVSVKGALGLMQLMPATAEQFSVRDAFDPKENIDAGAKLLKSLLTRFGGDVALALGAYNAGPANVEAAGGVPRFPETVNYVNSILEALGGK